MASAKALAAAP